MQESSLNNQTHTDKNQIKNALLPPQRERERKSARESEREQQRGAQSEREKKVEGEHERDLALWESKQKREQARDGVSEKDSLITGSCGLMQWELHSRQQPTTFEATSLLTP